MDPLEAYDYLYNALVEVAEIERRSFGPLRGRRHSIAHLGSPPFLEILDGRWLTIAHTEGEFDVQWDAPDYRKLDAFANLEKIPIELLWKVRCAWFNSSVGAEKAADDVIHLLGETGSL